MEHRQTDKPEDICPRPEVLPPQSTEPMVPPLYSAAVYRCRDIEQADTLLGGGREGYVYVRERNPNADLLAEKCRALHAAERAEVAASGMAAISAVVLSQLAPGDRVVASNQLYGKTRTLLMTEGARLGIETTEVDVCDLAQVRTALDSGAKLLVVETIANPLLRVPDLAALAELAHAAQALLVVDNTFASPLLCRPLALGADLVVESLTKIMNGHSDVCLGLVCGREECWQRLPSVVATWGFTAAPFDCWMASRGLSTLALRIERASANAAAAAEFLSRDARVETVYYPGLPQHPDHAIAARQFGGLFGSMVSFTLAGGRAAADGFIRAARGIPFAPSLGDLSTTLSHPESTSHRGLSPAQREALGITGGTIRLSLGIESREAVLAALEEGLAGSRG